MHDGVRAVRGRVGQYPAKFLSYIMPIGYSADNLRNLLVKGSAAGLQYDLAMILLLGGIFFVLAFIGVRRYVGTDTARMAAAGS